MIGFLRHTRAVGLRDDRGVVRPIESPHLRLAKSIDADLLVFHRLAEVRRDLEFGPRTLTELLLAGLMMAALLYTGVMGLTHGVIEVGLVLLLFGVLVAVGLFTWRRTLRSQLPRLEARRRTLHPRCPSCRYDLAGLPPEPDACLVCPECGGAWRFEFSAQPD